MKKKYMKLEKELIKFIELGHSQEECAGFIEGFEKGVRINRELLIECVRTCLKDGDSITVDQQVDNFLLNIKRTRNEI